MGLEMQDSILTNIANWVAAACAIPVWLFTFIYGVRVRWYKSLLGIALFNLFLSFSMLFGMILSRRLVGYEWSWYQGLAVFVYTYMFLAFSFFFGIFLLERRRGKETMSVPIGKVLTGEIPIPKQSKEG